MYMYVRYKRKTRNSMSTHNPSQSFYVADEEEFFNIHELKNKTHMRTTMTLKVP